MRRTSLSRTVPPVLIAACVLAGLPSAGRAQLTDRCEAAAQGVDRALRYCNLVARTVELTQPRLGIGITGGNPVPGTFSTLGLRVGSLPRFSIDVRGTVVATKVPDIRQEDTGERLTFPLGSVAADAAVGVFRGFSPSSTMGGLFAVDLLGSLGTIPIPGGEGFAQANPITWGAGARLGLVRESFEVPGVSLSGTYHHVPEVVYGDPALQSYDAYFRADLDVTSWRLGVSKNVAFVAVAAGLGYDHYRSEVAFGAAVHDQGVTATAVVPPTEVTSHRTSAFANVALNFVLINLVGEVGWQQGTTLSEVPLPPKAELHPREGALFGSLALRLAM